MAREGTPTARRRPAGTALGAAAAALGLALALAPPGAAPAAAARGRFEDGARIELTGIVTDPQGLPMAGMHVVLEASRSQFSLRHFRRTKKETTRLTDLTNDRGAYSLEWLWNDYYNSFELLVGVPVRRPDGERLRVLERIDLTRRIAQGSPVVSSVVVEDAAFVANLRQFLATIQSADERKVHHEMGEPDRVERVEYPEHHEVAWWYFESGKVYRFRDGRLEHIEPFDPVAPFGRGDGR